MVSDSGIMEELTKRLDALLKIYELDKKQAETERKRAAERVIFARKDWRFISIYHNFQIWCSLG